MCKIVGGAKWNDAERTPIRQSSYVGCRKNLVDRAIAASGDDAINFSSASLSNGFAGQSYSIAGFPSDPNFHNLTVLAHCANGRPQSSIAGCLAVQNNPDGCHPLSTLVFKS